MDNLNWSILEALQGNARLSYSELGRKVGLSAPAVAERVLKMEESGIIKGYKTVIDLEKIGLPLRAIVGFRINHTQHITKFIQMIKQTPEVYDCTRVTGKDCLILKIAVSDFGKLEELIDRFVEYGETTTSVVLSTPVEHKVFLQKSTIKSPIIRNMKG